MKLDRTYLTETMRRLIETPSPVGYYEKMKPLVEETERDGSQKRALRAGLDHLPSPGA